MRYLCFLFLLLFSFAGAYSSNSEPIPKEQHPSENLPVSVTPSYPECKLNKEVQAAIEHFDELLEQERHNKKVGKEAYILRILH